MPSRVCPTCQLVVEGDADRCPRDGVLLAPLVAEAPPAPRPAPAAGRPSALASTLPQTPPIPTTTQVKPPTAGSEPASPTAATIKASLGDVLPSAVGMKLPGTEPRPAAAPSTVRQPPPTASRQPAAGPSTVRQPPAPRPAAGQPAAGQAPPQPGAPASTRTPPRPSPLASSQTGRMRSPYQPEAPANSPTGTTQASPGAQPKAEPPSGAVPLADTMSPESMARQGLVLPTHVSVNIKEEPAQKLVGKLLIEKYRVLRLLGEGGMGEVFLAEHEAIGKLVALKLLRSEHAQKPDVVARFRLEARSASRIQHPNVVQVFDFGQVDDGRFYLALEYLEGNDLAHQLQQRGLLEPQRAIYITLQVCAALSAAHASGVIHRDMKPENVFLQRNRAGFDDVKIVDFGIAKMREITEGIVGTEVAAPGAGTGERERRLTKAGSVFGTPEYMAPEQATGREVDHRADLYAVGIMLYEMLTGRVPFESDNMLQTLSQHVHEPPRPPRQANPSVPISAELEAVILRSLAKNPADRHASMDAFAEALQATPEGVQLLTTVRGAMPLSFNTAIPSPRASSSRTSSPTPAEPAEAASPDELIEIHEPDPTSRASHAPLPLITQRSQTNTERFDFDASPSSSRPAPERRPPIAALLGGLGVLALLAGAGWFALHQASASPPQPGASVSAPVALEPPASSSAPTPAAPASTAAPASAAPSAPPASPQGPAIVLRVTTEPTGAVIHKGDFQVCDASPCDVSVQPNEAVELTATRGDKRGSAKVLAQRNQVVIIRLTRASGAGKAPAPHAGAAGAPAGAAGSPGGRNATQVPMCEFLEGDLKILRPCK